MRSHFPGFLRLRPNKEFFKLNEQLEPYIKVKSRSKTRPVLKSRYSSRYMPGPGAVVACAVYL